MSWFTNIRDSVTGTAKDIATGGLSLAGGPMGLLTGGLTGPLSGLAGATGLMGLLGGGGLAGMAGGGMGGGMFSSIAPSAFGTSTTGQPSSLMDMLGQQYQTGPVSQTGNMNLNSQGLT